MLLSLMPLLAVGLPAGELLTYHRADGPTRLVFDPTALADKPLDPRLCGNFVEHLGGVIYDGIWAQCLAAPTLEPLPDGPWGWYQREPWQAFVGRDTPFPWQIDGDLQAQVAPDCGADRQALRLTSATAGTLCQRTELPLHRVSTYRGSLYLRVIERPRSLRLVVGHPDQPTELGAATLSLPGDTWLEVPFGLVVQPGAPGNRVRVALELAGPGSVEVDRLELYPTDAVEGFDPDIERLTRDWRIPMLRYPGGNFVSGYHWRDGVGPLLGRRTMANPAWGGVEYNRFGTDEFMRFCDRVGTEPMICVNMGNGTPEEAAAWVEYCNGPATTPMGALRAANGHPAPYDVRVWEVGNEIYGSWQIGHCDKDENLRRYNTFSAAMLAVDPSIELIATGEHGHDAWQETLLRGARPLTCISEHPLIHPGHMPQDETAAAMWPRLAAHPWWYWRDYLPHVRELAARHGRPEVAIAVTEWGIIAVPDPRNLLELPHAENQAGAVYAGCFLNALLRGHEQVAIANITGLLHGGGLRKRGEFATGDPQYYVARLFVEAMGGRLMRLDQTGPGYDADARNGLRATANVPWLDATGVLAADGDRAFVYLINRSLTEPIEPELDLPGFQMTAGWRVDSGGDMLARNTPERPTAVAAEPLELADRTPLRLPPLSVTRLDFQRSGR